MIQDWTILDLPDVAGINTEALTLTSDTSGIHVTGQVIIDGTTYPVNESLPWPPGPPSGYWDQWFVVLRRTPPPVFRIGVNTNPTHRWHDSITIALGWRAHPEHPMKAAFAPGWAVRYRHKTWDPQKDGPHRGYAVRANGHVTHFVPGQGEQTLHPPRV